MKNNEWCEGEPYFFHYCKKRKKIRCSKCGRRLLLQTHYCVGGEFVGFKIPPHKLRVHKRKSPSRKTK